MQIRPKTYLHFISLWRLFHKPISPHQGDVRAEASTFLIYSVIVLVLLLAILEIDAHRSELESLGLLGRDYPIQAAFFGP